MKYSNPALPEHTCNELRAEAKRSSLRTTAFARDAISLSLRARKKKERHNAIAAYAAQTARTKVDLDLRLEAAAIEQLLESGRE